MPEQQRHLPSAFIEIELQTSIAVDLQQTLREFRVEWGTLLQGIWWEVFRWLDVFRNRFYDLNPYISSFLEKH